MAVSNVGDYLIGSAWGLPPLSELLMWPIQWARPSPLSARQCPHLDKYISFILFSGFLPLLLYGLALAYYLPAIPFIRWLSALWGWIILVVEALVAAPLALRPCPCQMARGLRDNTANAAIFLLLGIVLRPPLMVTGFFAAVILMNVLGRILGASFEMFVGGTAQTKILGIGPEHFPCSLFSALWS